jgi:hypothetical protein
MAPDPQSGTTPVRLRHRSLNLPTWRNGRRSRPRTCPGASPQVRVRVSPSALLPSFGDMRVVPRPVCKTGARSEHWRSHSSVTDCFSHIASVAQLARANGSYPCGSRFNSWRGHYTAPVGAAHEHAALSQRRPSVGIRHGRPFAGVAKQVDAPRPERDALRRTAGSNPAAGTQSS